MVTEHIAAQRALARLGTRGLVVGDPLGWNQERRDAIDQRGLAGADVAGEQAVVAVELERPDAVVECTPVVHLKARKAETGAIAVHKAQQVVLQPCFAIVHGLSSRSAAISTKWSR